MAPKAEKKPAKKVAKKVAGGKGKKGKSKVESFKIYIYKVLKQVRAYLDSSSFIAALLTPLTPLPASAIWSNVAGCLSMPLTGLSCDRSHRNYVQ